jgi:hypothetical protein
MTRFHVKNAYPSSPTAYLPSHFSPSRVTLIGPGQIIRNLPTTSLPPVESRPDWPRSTYPRTPLNFTSRCGESPRLAQVNKPETSPQPRFHPLRVTLTGPGQQTRNLPTTSSRGSSIDAHPFRLHISVRHVTNADVQFLTCILVKSVEVPCMGGDLDRWRRRQVAGAVYIQHVLHCSAPLFFVTSSWQLAECIPWVCMCTRNDGTRLHTYVCTLTRYHAIH